MSPQAHGDVLRLQGTYGTFGHSGLYRSIQLHVGRKAERTDSQCTVWTEARTAGQIQSQSNVLLSGNEQNLLSYYPMDEAEGTTLKDKARGLNLGMSGGTWILPEGKSLQLNGVNTYLKLLPEARSL